MIYHFPPTKLNHQSLIGTCREIFTTYRTHEEISSDGGPQFIAHQLQEFLHQWGVQHRSSSGEYPQSNGRAELGLKSAKRIIYDNVAPNGSLNTNAVARAIFQYYNTPLPEINLNPTQILFHRQLHDHFPVNQCFYHLHEDWIISSKQTKDYAYQQNQQIRENYDSPVTQEHPALEVGINVIIYNTRNSAKARWDKTGTIVEKRPFRQYRDLNLVKITGSGHIVLSNDKFIIEIPPSTNHISFLSPLHNHPEIQNNPDIQSEYTSSEMRYQMNHKMSPILCIMIPH